MAERRIRRHADVGPLCPRFAPRPQTGEALPDPYHFRDSNRAWAICTMHTERAAHEFPSTRTIVHGVAVVVAGR